MIERDFGVVNLSVVTVGKELQAGFAWLRQDQALPSSTLNVEWVTEEWMANLAVDPGPLLARQRWLEPDLRHVNINDDDEWLDRPRVQGYIEPYS
jgi:hypothetical protein